ncbi:MAG: hypothetical protein IT336_04265 [Thermomicrobiales bacterium]|nr:hypothetical protein [Thermomicrobiales bacterium]
MESGPTRAVLGSGFHPYTRALVSATPVDHPGQVKQRIPLVGEPTSPIDPPSHCRLAPRCPYALPVCTAETASLVEVMPGRATRCIRFQREHVGGTWNPEPTRKADIEGVPSSPS